jgi:acetyltransferase-like isoleucine patch superfamily enzyme
MGKPIYTFNLRNLTLGRNVKIYPGSRIEILKDAEVILEDNVAIGQNIHLTAGARLVVGAGTTISGNVLLTDIDHEYRLIDINVMKQPLRIKDTRIGPNCFIGYGAAILPGTILGKQCIVGANSVVRGVFKDYSVIVGNPGKVIRQYNLNREVWENITN